jgi:hypothetical protein
MPADKFDRIKGICSLDAEFIALPDIETPDFYHPYKRGAYQFQLASTNADIQLDVVTDTALRLNLAPYSTSALIVSNTLGDLCGSTEDDILGKLKFPTLPNFVNAWLDLASREQVVGTEEEIVFLVNAERLIDICETWQGDRKPCDQTSHADGCISVNKTVSTKQVLSHHIIGNEYVR